MGKVNETSYPETVRVESFNGFAGVFAAKNYAPGDHLLPLRGRTPARRSRYTIQIGVDRHLDPEPTTNGVAAAPAPWKYLNHSCDPNLDIDLAASCFSARREIASGEELTFNYLTTEWELATPFECMCGSPTCYGTIRGFKHLLPGDQERLLSSTAPHIRTLLAHTHEASAASRRSENGGSRSVRRHGR